MHGKQLGNSAGKLQKVLCFNLSYRKDDCTPWDAGKAQPPLTEILTNPMLSFPPDGRALVPGCGRVSRCLLIGMLFLAESIMHRDTIHCTLPRI